MSETVHDDYEDEIECLSGVFAPVWDDDGKCVCCGRCIDCDSRRCDGACRPRA